MSFYKVPSYVHKSDAWSIRLTVDPFSIPLSLILNKFIWISPNFITILSFLTTILSLYFLLLGYEYWFVGAIIWHFSNILDSCDGKVARMRNACTDFGATLDTMLDKIKKFLTLCVLLFMTNDNYVLLILLIFINYSLHYIKINQNPYVLRFFNWFGFKDLYDPLDFFLIVFVIGPILHSFFIPLISVVLLQISSIMLHVFFNYFQSLK